MSGLCALALATGLSWSMPAGEMILAWKHSIELQEWRETWRLDPGRLTLVEARVKGSGAGMEPGPGAQYENGWWIWHPMPPVEVRVLNLSRSGFVDDYTLCLDGTCRPMAIWLPGLGPVGNVQLSSC